MTNQRYPEVDLDPEPNDDDGYGTPEGTPYDVDEESAWIAESEPELGD